LQARLSFDRAAIEAFEAPIEADRIAFAGLALRAFAIKGKQ
jgi:hypothetical protein